MTTTGREVVSLSYGQQAMLLAHRAGAIGGGGVTMVVALGTEIPDEADLHQLLGRLQQRVDALRARLVMRRGRLVMEFLGPEQTPPIEVVEGELHHDDDWSVRNFRPWASEPFGRGVCPLARAMFVRRQGVSWLHLVLDQMVCDGWSIAVLADEITSIWQSITAGRPVTEEPGSFREYLEEQATHRSEEALARYRDYWGEVFSHDVALDLPRRDTSGGAVLNFVIPEAISCQLPRLRKARRTTDFALFTSILSMVLARRCRQRALVACSHISDRQTPSTLRTVGWLINYLGVPFEISATLEDTVRSCQRGFFGALEHQVGPFFEVAPRSRDDGAIVAIEPHAQHALTLHGYAREVWDPWGWDNDCRNPGSDQAKMGSGELDWMVKSFPSPPLGDVAFHYKPASWGYILGLIFSCKFLDESAAREVGAEFLEALELECHRAAA